MRLATLLLLATLTAQARWELQDSHTKADLRGIDNVGNGIAWASGSNGTILRTIDGGDHWQLCPVPSEAAKLDFRGIQAFDANSAIVMSSGKGDLSRLYKTTDACQTWRPLFTNPDPEGFWDAIRFDMTNNRQRPSGHMRGVLIGDPIHGEFVIYRSENSGGDLASVGTIKVSPSSRSATWRISFRSKQ